MNWDDEWDSLPDDAWVPGGIMNGRWFEIRKRDISRWFDAKPDTGDGVEIRYTDGALGKLGWTKVELPSNEADE